MPNRVRETYGGDADPAGLIPEIRMLGWDRFKSATIARLAPHRHPTAYEICYLIDGHVDWWVEAEMHTIRRGMVYVTRPNEIHGGVDAVMHACELHWLQIEVDTLPATLRDELPRLPRRVFPGSDRLGGLFETLLMEHRVRTLLSPIAARAALHALLVQIVRDAACNVERSEAYSSAIAQALSLLAADLSATLSLEQVASKLGISPPRLTERFLSEVGETPREWRTRRRLHAAREALRERHAVVTEVAFRFGFASSQYFATAFKRQFGLSPSQWRDTMKLSQ